MNGLDGDDAALRLSAMSLTDGAAHDRDATLDAVILTRAFPGESAGAGAVIVDQAAGDHRKQV